MNFVERARKLKYLLLQLASLRREARVVNAPCLEVMMKRLFFLLHQKNIIVSNNVLIYGLENVDTAGLLRIGMSHFGFMNYRDQTFLNVDGSLSFGGDYSIAKGCRFDIGGQATAVIGGGGCGPNSLFVISHRLEIGSGTIISWACQFLDADHHELRYEGKKVRQQGIKIGERVWIGSNVSVLKGAVIPDGCMVAAGSVVCSAFVQKNSLLAGNPARVVRENISWF